MQKWLNNLLINVVSSIRIFTFSYATETNLRNAYILTPIGKRNLEIQLPSKANLQDL